MLDKEVFSKGIHELEIEYAGFILTPEREKQWYEKLGYLSNANFSRKIEDVLKVCNHIPYMADLFLSEKQVDHSLEDCKTWDPNELRR